MLHLSPGTKEDTESCRAFFQDLKRRGLRDPLFVATDGAPGLIRAVEECFECFPRTERGRCLAHRMRNLQAKVRCFLDDFEACIAHLRFPIAHRRVIRTTNLLGRLFGEERRRMKTWRTRLASARCSS